MSALSDLKPGTRICHVRWGCTGTVKVDGDLVHAKWDGSSVDDEIGDSGPVFPADVAIVTQDGA